MEVNLPDAKRKRLHWTDEEEDKLKVLVSGHRFLAVLDISLLNYTPSLRYC